MIPPSALPVDHCRRCLADPYPQVSGAAGWSRGGLAAVPDSRCNVVVLIPPCAQVMSVALLAVALEGLDLPPSGRDLALSEFSLVSQSGD